MSVKEIERNASLGSTTSSALRRVGNWIFDTPPPIDGSIWLYEQFDMTISVIILYTFSLLEPYFWHA